MYYSAFLQWNLKKGQVNDLNYSGFNKAKYVN